MRPRLHADGSREPWLTWLNRELSLDFGSALGRAECFQINFEIFCGFNSSEARLSKPGSPNCSMNSVRRG